MSHTVRIKSGLTNVELPNGIAYNGGDVVTLTDEEYEKLASTALGDEVLNVVGIRDFSTAPHFKIWEYGTDLASIANGNLTTVTPGFAGTIVGWQAITSIAATTASKASTLNLEIGSTAVGTTPSTLSLTTASLNAVGKVLAATAVSGANSFNTTDVITLQAASTTAFAEGRIIIQVFLTA